MPCRQDMVSRATPVGLRHGTDFLFTFFSRFLVTGQPRLIPGSKALQHHKGRDTDWHRPKALANKKRQNWSTPG